MKKIASVVLLLAVAVFIYRFYSAPASSSFEPEEGYQLLYAGGALNGWRKIGGNATFQAEGDEIIGRHGPGANTFLRTEKEYGDFSLKLQMRWDEFGNSGVMFRAQQREGDGRAYGYQYELDPSERAWSGGIYDEARRGWLANLTDNEAARAAIKLDDWNDVEIEARGAQLKTWINDVPAADIIDGLDARGYIALQVHSGESGVMRWRRIRLKELPPMAVVGADLMRAEEWRGTDQQYLEFSEQRIAGSFPAEPVELSPRRQFGDALMRFSLPVCDTPTIIRMRYVDEEGGKGGSFAQVKVFRNRAEAELVDGSNIQRFEPVDLAGAERHTVVTTARGQSVVVSVADTDVLRVTESTIPARGRLSIQPARCAPEFEIRDFDWLALREGSSETLFYQTLDNEPASVLSPEQALQAFRIAPGFTVELVAAEPLVEDPVAMAWDEYGRLYVVELRGYMRDPYGTDSEKPVGRVVRLTDDDGDGKMDRSEAFLDQLVNPRAVAVVNEGVLVGVPPNLYLCKLPDKNALCTRPQRVGAYAANVASANVEHLENGLRQGLDNWLYNSKSTRQLRLVNGELLERESLFRGQWGITKDDYGRLLYNHNSTWLQADFFAAEDLIQAGDTAEYAGLGENLTLNPEVFSVRVNPGVNRAYLDTTLRPDGRLHRATGVSGLVAYRGDQFPEKFRGDVFVPESAGNVVAQFALHEAGLGLRAEQRLYEDEQWGQRDFLGSTDERFRPVDAMNGPDGALYIIDMYRGIIQDDQYLTEELREQIFQRGLDKPIGLGRIWRVRHEQGTANANAVNLGDASSQVLLQALQHENGWVRDTAQRLLLTSDDAVQPALADIALGDESIPALHAIWALQGRDELQRSLVLDVLAIDDIPRQVNALRAGRDQLTQDDLLLLYQQWHDAPVALRMQLALATTQASETDAVQQALAALLTTGNDNVYLRQAVVRAVRSHELAFLAVLLNAKDYQTDKEGARQALAALGGNAYRTLRPDVTVTQPATAQLLELLQLTASRTGAAAWQQIALLEGFSEVATVEGFVPALLSAAPPIFADASVSEKDPLWQARLAGRVAFTWPGDELAMGIKPLSPEQLQSMELGKDFYPQCAACHGDLGQGIEGLAPPLAGADWVTGPPEWLGRIILQGISGPLEVNGVTWQGVMPPHGHMDALDDAVLAGLMTYLRRSWGNTADPVSTETAKDIRTMSAQRDAPWTAEELTAVPFDRGFDRFVGKYAVSFLTLTVSEEPDGLHLSVPMYGSGIMTQLTDTVFTAAAGGENVKLEFVVEDSGAVNEILMHRKGEKISIKRKAK